MVKFKISEILTATGGKLVQGDAALTVHNVVINSRLIKKGDLFLAVIGSKHDGHTFIPEAIKRGAAGVVVSKSTGDCPSRLAVIKVKNTTKALGDIARLHRLRFLLPVIAITGSAGKTTTKEMIAAILKRKFKVLKNIGTENNQFGVPLTILKLTKAHEIAVLEIGTNRPGDIAWLASIVCPTVAVLTNIGESHLQRLKSPADVFKEKFALVKALENNGVVIANLDDLFLKKMGSLTQKKFISFGIINAAQTRARVLYVRRGQIVFSLAGVGQIIVQGTATANVYNALAAINCARLFKVGYTDIKKVLKTFTLKSGRQTMIKVGGIRLMNDSYNANPVSFRSALEGLAQYKTLGRKILICGDMLELGTQAKRLHAEIGQRAAKVGVSVILSFGKLSRWISSAAKKTNPEIETLHSDQIAEIQTQISKHLRPFDIVLIKGSRGMKMERFVEYIQTHFN
ncbi:MAG: UDP-N-acetylmuramoyl-tripeptide--D-alanyl-D-alanine ligase [Candidatus Omnitrophica bacterium]|nr:UDP-N-acetylmuramoyl-tripeptide--D-alanyl-D-alanine ligase [Candidatus Omnitrophota bacterium]